MHLPTQYVCDYHNLTMYFEMNVANNLSTAKFPVIFRWHFAKDLIYN